MKYQGPFDKRFLITLFKCCENTCGLKIRVMEFKYRKLLFELRYQTKPKSFETSVFAKRKLATNFPGESEQRDKVKQNLYKS